MTETDNLIALAHMGACMALAWCCVCRIKAMSKDTTRLLTRLAYSVLLTDAVAVGLMPIWLRDSWGQWSAMALASGYVLVMAVNARGWLRGPPDYARSGPMPLDDAASHPVVSGGEPWNGS